MTVTRVVELLTFFSQYVFARIAQSFAARVSVLWVLMESPSLCVLGASELRLPWTRKSNEYNGSSRGAYRFQPHTFCECGQARTHPGRRPGWSIGVFRTAVNGDQTTASYLSNLIQRSLGIRIAGLVSRAGLSEGAFFPFSVQKSINRDPEIQLHHAASCGSGPPAPYWHSSRPSGAKQFPLEPPSPKRAKQ